MQFITFGFQFFLVLAISACAAKKSNLPPLYQDLPPGQNASKPNDGLPFPTAEAPVERPPGERLALVVGGVGVSSFATVGMLKRFQQAGVRVDLIVASGWPAVFALGYGSFKSVHDLEWFAMRLTEKDFSRAGKYEEGSAEGFLSATMASVFKKDDLRLSRVPIIISPKNTELGKDAASTGDWKEPLLASLSIPGLYRKGPDSFGSAEALAVEEARKQGIKKIVVVSMYPDYLAALSSRDFGKGSAEFNAAYAEILKRSIHHAKEDTLYGEIMLGVDPLSFASRRQAILAGAKEAARLLKSIRK